eukprot:SAG22_NODE_574_length_8996_cov_12.163875_1_plen_216_part_00
MYAVYAALYVRFQVDTPRVCRRPRATAWQCMAATERAAPRPCRRMVLQRAAHTAGELETFHRLGYVVFPGVMRPEAAAAFREELLTLKQTRSADGADVRLDAAAFLALPAEERAELNDPKNALGAHQFGPVRNWDAKGAVGDALLDPPLVIGFLRAVMGRFNFCHSAMSISTRGRGATPCHQDAGAGLADRIASYTSQRAQSERYTRERDDWCAC